MKWLYIYVKKRKKEKEKHRKPSALYMLLEGKSFDKCRGVVISWGILPCPPVSECIYVISIVVIEECQKYFITRSVVIPRTLF